MSDASAEGPVPIKVSQDNVDYQETSDITQVHAAIQREHQEPLFHSVPVPLWLLVLCGFVIFGAGSYLSLFHGGFRGDVFNERETSPALLFPTVSKAGPGAGLAKEENQRDLGLKLYALNCQQCHQPNGLGVPGQYPPLANSEWVVGSQERLAMIVLKGLEGPVKVAGVMYNNSGMVGREKDLNDKKIAAILTYIRSDWGNKAEEITSEQVNVVRKKQTERKTPMTEADLLAVPDEPAGGGDKAAAP